MSVIIVIVRLEKLIDFHFGKDSFEGYVSRSNHIKIVNSPNRKRTSIKVHEGKYKGLNVEFNDSYSVEVVVNCSPK